MQRITTCLSLMESKWLLEKVFLFQSIPASNFRGSSVIRSLVL